MQRKAYVTSAAALLAALLAGCTGCSPDTGTGASPDDSKQYDAGASAAPAPPGKYRTLPEACSQVDQSTLDSMLPGIKTITDEKQRERAYEGTASLTYETDRRVGCRWTGESPYATDHLVIDFERVVSYDTTVSDDNRAQQVFFSKEADAHIDDPAASTAAATPGETQKADGGEGLSADSTTADEDTTGTPSDACGGPSAGDSGSDGTTADTDGTDGTDGSDDSDGSNGSDATSGSGPEAADGLRSRTLDGLGDAAFLDDTCAAPSSAARHRTVTVVFRTSNVIVTVEYDEQPSRPDDVPDSKKMQDTAQELAHTLAGKLSG